MRRPAASLSEDRPRRMSWEWYCRSSASDLHESMLLRRVALSVARRRPEVAEEGAGAGGGEAGTTADAAIARGGEE